MISVLNIGVYNNEHVIYKVLVLADHPAESPVNTEELIQRMLLGTPAVYVRQVGNYV